MVKIIEVKLTCISGRYETHDYGHDSLEMKKEYFNTGMLVLKLNEIVKV